MCLVFLRSLRPLLEKKKKKSDYYIKPLRTDRGVNFILMILMNFVKIIA